MAGDKIELEGDVLVEKGGGHFLIRLDNDKEVIASLSGRMRDRKIRVIIGDRVRVAFSPYDLMRGQIVYRQR